MGKTPKKRVRIKAEVIASSLQEKIEIAQRAIEDVANTPLEVKITEVPLDVDPEALSQLTTTGPIRKLWKYRVRVQTTNSVEPVQNYYVTAPTQCAATKFTAAQEEVTGILFVQRIEYNFPEGGHTLYTEEDC